MGHGTVIVTPRVANAMHLKNRLRYNNNWSRHSRRIEPIKPSACPSAKVNVQRSDDRECQAKERARGDVAPVKYRPEVALKFPVLACKFPVLPQKFPVLLSREFRCKALNVLVCQLSKSHLAGGLAEIPC
jgi:hypothetical protein